MYLNRPLACAFFLALAALPLSQAARPSIPVKTIFTFAGPADTSPVSTMPIDSNGALYGITKHGGNSGAGTVFKLSPPASPGGAWTETVLYPFTGQKGDGAVPAGSLVLGAGSVIYGTTVAGGADGCGTVFELRPPSGSGGWTETVLYSFTCGADGGQPRGGVVIGNGGVLYGTASSNGAGTCGGVFSLKPPQSQGAAWTESVLYSFTGASGDGCTPLSGLVFGKGQVLYGVTETGGSSGNGTVFQLSPPSAGNPWTESVLWSFAGGSSDGAVPNSTLALASTGSLFGTTRAGGVAGLGTAFALTPPSGSGGAWIEAVVHSFGAVGDGSTPLSLTLGSGSFIYGTTAYTGTSTICASGCGTVFELKPPNGSGGSWIEIVLHTFTGESGDGNYPQGGVTVDSKGLLYGATYLGGSSTNCGTGGCGMAFELTP